MPVDLRSIPRAPGRLPILGHLLPLLRDPLPFLENLHEHGPVVRVDLGALPVYFVTTVELARDVLVNQARSLHKGRIFERLRALSEQGLLVIDGSTHHRHRRLMQPLFTPARIAEHAEIMSRRAGELADSWTAGDVIDLDREIKDLALGTLVETMFRSALGQHAAATVRHDTRVLSENLMLRTLSPPLLDRLPVLRATRRFAAAAARMKAIVDDVVAVHRADGTHDSDLLSTLLVARDTDTGEKFSDAEVRDELVTILLAGSETSANTISWVFYELSRSPQVEQRLLAELDAVVGSGPVAWQDLRRLEFTTRVVNETERLHSPPIVMRHTTETIELDGLRVPSGVELALSLYALHRDPRVFPAPGRFDPDRWRTPPPRHAFIPFGAGNRKCIGESFAWAQVLTTVATLAARWRFQPVPSHQVREMIAATTYPDRLPMTVTERISGE
jgi:cytochrome P450